MTATNAPSGGREVARLRTAPAWAARVLLACTSVVSTLLAVEVIVRALGWEVAPAPEYVGKAMAWTKVEEKPAPGSNAPPNRLEFVNTPGDYRQAYRLRRHDPPRMVDIHVNPAGFRGPELPRQKAPGTLRIACLGDSYTFGFGVSDAETWPAQLEHQLGGADARVEVLNAGVNNYDTLQEVEMLRRRVLPYDPDLVLLAFFLNDAAIRVNTHGYEYGEEPFLWRLMQRNPAIAVLRRSSRLADVLADRIVQRQYLTFLASSRSQLYTTDSVGWRAAQKELKTAKAVLEARSIPFVVVLYPLLCRVGEQLATREAYAVVRDFLAREQIACLDLEPAFLRHDVDCLRVHPRDSHPNAEGHRIAAEAIASFLREQELVPTPEMIKNR